MSDVNHVILIGRLTRDAELKYTSGGSAVCKFALAVGKKYKKDDQYVEETSFFDVTLWGKLGESINQYLTKGKQVAVEGELKQDRWEQDGQARSKVSVTASNVMLLGGGQSGISHAAPAADPNAPPGFPGGPSAGNPASKADGTPPDFPDDIPF